MPVEEPTRLTIEDIQAAINARRSAEIRQAEELQKQKEQAEREHLEKMKNPEYAATYAEMMAKETEERERKRAETLTRARLEYL